VFGPWRNAGIALGLLAVGSGLVVVLRHSVLRTALKTAVVAVTVTALGAFAFFGVEQVPTTLPSCAPVEEPTIENRETVYCLQGDGSLTRISIGYVDDCGAHAITYETRQSHEWSATWISSGCRL